ncbi:MAG: alpha/beta hydrolase [Rhodobacteraceae bacterium]|nr:alpha/beta hydrolase [Paracoccaceae bacterium]
MAPNPDYDRLIDAETWAFIHETERWYPPEAAGFTIAEQRAVYDRMCSAFRRGRPPGVTAVDRPFGDVPCRLYAPPGGGLPGWLVYFPGGGFVVGGLDSHDDICAELCAGTGLCTVSVDYRLSPEHPHPAAFADALAATRAIAAEGGSPIVLAGDSAGGNLAAAVSHAVRRTGPAIAGQVLIYPGLGGDMSAGSHVIHAHAPMLTRADLLFYRGVRYPGGVVPDRPDPTADPLADEDFSGLPPTLAIAAECDPLADDARAYAARIVSAGGRALSVEEAGLVHGYLRARHSVGRAAAGFARITSAIASLARGEWPPTAPESSAVPAFCPAARP